jgi:hypothetical protein
MRTNVSPLTSLSPFAYPKERIMKKTLSLALAAAMLAGAMALPALADAPNDTGIFNGQATVGIDRGTDPAGHCKPDGTATVKGQGIPFLGGVAKAYWKIDAPIGQVISLGRVATGALKMCGTLLPTVTDPAQVGASCITTHGVDGKGKATFVNGDVIWLDGLNWTATVGGTFLVTAKVGSSQGDVGSDLVAAVQALDEAVVANCLSSNGATTFNVQAAYAVVA